jgi:tRNA(fMet)-specific endonuclease VapC
MKVSYLIDTDWIIHYLNGNNEIVEKIKSLGRGILAVSVVSLAELYEGVYYSTNPEGNEEALENFLSGISILGIEDNVCKVFGKERGRLRQSKKMIGDFDIAPLYHSEERETCKWRGGQ